MRWVRATAIGLALTFCRGGMERGWSQMPTTGVQQPQYPGQSGRKGGVQTPGMGPDTDDMTTKVQEQQSKSRNSERQKRLEGDTEKLLALATELKEQVGKTDKNILSIDVIKKADEIERLAKSVKERMKG